jgi:dCMP deaminase
MVECSFEDHFNVPDPVMHECPPDVCACGNEWPCPDAVAPGSSYDTGPGACIGTHAEHNAVDDAKTKGAGRMAGGVQYVSCEPCEGCVRLIRNTTDIEAIIWPDGVTALP